jgi:hypothetical protein
MSQAKEFTAAVGHLRIFMTMQSKVAGVVAVMLVACTEAQGPPVEGPAPAAATAAAAQETAAAPPAAATTPYDEARDRLTQIKAGALAYFAAHSAYPSGQVAVVPAIDCCKQNYQGSGRCAPDPKTFADPIWADLGFTPAVAPHYFQVVYFGTASSFTLAASGDIDCDSTSITFTLLGSSVSGTPYVQLVEPVLEND